LNRARGFTLCDECHRRSPPAPIEKFADLMGHLGYWTSANSAGEELGQGFYQRQPSLLGSESMPLHQRCAEGRWKSRMLQIGSPAAGKEVSSAETVDNILDDHSMRSGPVELVCFREDLLDRRSEC